MKKWLDNSIQFPRLLCEIIATHENIEFTLLAESMDLSMEEVDELFERAHNEWEEIKEQECPSHNGIF